MFYYVALQIDSLNANANPTFRTELFHESVIITALTKIKAPDISKDKSDDDIKRYIINDDTVIGQNTSGNYTTRVKPTDNTTNRFVWMNGMFLGYMRQFENAKTHGFETYRFIEANEDLTEGNLVSNVRNPKLWFLKNYLVSKTPIKNIKTNIEEIKQMYATDKRNLYFTYYPTNDALSSAIDNQTY